MRGPTLMLGPVRMVMLLYCANASGAASVRSMLAATTDRTPDFIRLKDRLPRPVLVIWRPRKSMLATQCRRISDQSALTTRLMIFSPCSLVISFAASSFDSALSPNRTRNMPDFGPETMEAL